MTYVDLEKELGITPELVEQYHRAKTVSVPSDLVYITPSDIEGMGVRAMRPFSTEQQIAIARTAEGDRTIYGRYLNHSDTPNAHLHKNLRNELELILRASAPILAGEEITIDYRTTLRRPTNVI